MTGVLNAMAGMVTGQRYAVTIGSIGVDNYGYNTGGPVGAISPSTFGGRSIVDCSSEAGERNFNFALGGTELPQSFFRSIMVQRTNGSWSIYNSADATFVGTPTGNSWAWFGSSGDDPAWTATSPSPRAIIIS